ncbi:MAG: PEP-CTERM sorting domain-containing protein [Planctomycetes bacterium]|nr:PEP-CTERM sorting domain-containing protein [Planctomycetota bacterium]
MKSLILTNLNFVRLMSLATAAIAVCCAASIVEAAPYQDAVNALLPTYYYELNETDTLGGVIDSTGNADPGTYNGDYEFGAPQVGGPGPLTVFHEGEQIPVPGVGGEANVAHYSNNEGHIRLGPNTLYGSSAITVAMFFKAGPAQGGDRLFTNNLADPLKSFQVNVANDGLVIAVDPSQEGFNAERTLFMPDNSGPDRRLIQSGSGWFHVVATTHGNSGAERAENIRVWINGEDRTDNLQPNVVGWGIDTDMAKIGGRHADPRATTTHSGAQDEVAIWIDRALSDDDVASLWAAATGTGGPLSDLNGNGFVDFEDLTILLANWNKDVAADGGNLVEPQTTVVNFADLTVLLADWTGPGPAGSPEAALDAQAVPEPSTLVLAMFGLLGLAGLRRRRR